MIPFVPRWVTALFNNLWFTFIGDDLEDIFVGLTLPVTVVVYLGVAIYSGIQSGSAINTIA